MNPQPTSGIDATKKLPGEGHKRDWPPLIKMDEATQKKIDTLLGGNRPRRGPRQSQPFRTTLPAGNGTFPKRLPPAAVTLRTFEQSHNRWGKTAGDRRTDLE